jgi:guanyl-specific ribonuclease Sa
MRLSRPVAIGLLVLCALVVLWLVAQNLPTEDDPAAAPTSSAGAPSSTGAGSPSGSASPTFADLGDREERADLPSPEDGDEDGPTGTDTRDWDDIDACRDDVLPPELEEVADDVESGGPFDYPEKDGSTFGNYEGYLPDEARGYYREYTVETPGLDHRGARRIVTGGDGGLPEVWYFTRDHYESFCEFAP